jgi:hypothetical protein
MRVSPARDGIAKCIVGQLVEKCSARRVRGDSSGAKVPELILEMSGQLVDEIRFVRRLYP